MDKKLEFVLALNGNPRKISVSKNNEDGYVIKLENIEAATIMRNDGCWIQTHGGKLPQHFIDEIGKHIIPLK